MMPKLILASQSPTRRQLLTRAGIDYRSVSPKIDEEMLKKQGLENNLSHEQIALSLAEHKAKQISDDNPDAYVLGCDQVLSCAGKLLSKTQDIQAAREQLLFLKGKDHTLISALVIARQGEIIWQYSDKASLRVRWFSDDFLDEYLKQMANDILKSVGCYQLEGQGIQLFSKVQGDYYTILGLPLLPLLGFLRQHGMIME